MKEQIELRPTLLIDSMESMAQVAANTTDESMAWWLLIIIPVLLIIPYFLWRKRKNK